MKLQPNRCPECGRLAIGICETVPGLALIAFDDESEEAHYQGTTEMFWDDQQRVQDSEGRVTLVCSEGHDWSATILVG